MPRPSMVRLSSTELVAESRTPGSGLSARPLNRLKIAALPAMPSESTAITTSEKRGILDEHADAEAHVLPHVDEHRDHAAAPHLPRVFLRLQHVAELVDRGEPRRFRILAGGDALGDRHLEVAANLGVEVAVDARGAGRASAVDSCQPFGCVSG